MSELFRTLTTDDVEGEPMYCNYLLPGCVKQLAANVTLYLGSDRISDEKGERYEPGIALFCKGRPMPSINDGFCFDLSNQIGFVICIRGMRVDVNGKPIRFLVEVYKQQKQPCHLRLVS